MFLKKQMNNVEIIIFESIIIFVISFNVQLLLSFSILVFVMFLIMST